MFNFIYLKENVLMTQIASSAATQMSKTSATQGIHSNKQNKNNSASNTQDTSNDMRAAPVQPLMTPQHSDLL